MVLGWVRAWVRPSRGAARGGGGRRVEPECGRRDLDDVDVGIMAATRQEKAHADEGRPRVTTPVGGRTRYRVPTGQRGIAIGSPTTSTTWLLRSY